MEDPPIERTTSKVDVRDEDVLAEFGYKQELKRDWGLTHNFGISFSIIVGLVRREDWECLLMGFAVCYYWYYYAVSIWASYRRSWRYVDAARTWSSADQK
jgi:hypothetical protein